MPPKVHPPEDRPGPVLRARPMPMTPAAPAAIPPKSAPPAAGPVHRADGPISRPDFPATTGGLRTRNVHETEGRERQDAARHVQIETPGLGQDGSPVARKNSKIDKGKGKRKSGDPVEDGDRGNPSVSPPPSSHAPRVDNSSSTPGASNNARVHPKSLSSLPKGKQTASSLLPPDPARPNATPSGQPTPQTSQHPSQQSAAPSHTYALNFGRYMGRTLYEIEPAYVSWLLSRREAVNFSAPKYHGLRVALRDFLRRNPEFGTSMNSQARPLNVDDAAQNIDIPPQQPFSGLRDSAHGSPLSSRLSTPTPGPSSLPVDSSNLGMRQSPGVPQTPRQSHHSIVPGAPSQVRLPRQVRSTPYMRSPALSNRGLVPQRYNPGPQGRRDATGQRLSLEPPFHRPPQQPPQFPLRSSSAHRDLDALRDSLADVSPVRRLASPINLSDLPPAPHNTPRAPSPGLEVPREALSYGARTQLAAEAGLQQSQPQPRPLQVARNPFPSNHPPGQPPDSPRPTPPGDDRRKRRRVTPSDNETTDGTGNGVVQANRQVLQEAMGELRNYSRAFASYIISSTDRHVDDALRDQSERSRHNFNLLAQYISRASAQSNNNISVMLNDDLRQAHAARDEAQGQLKDLNNNLQQARDEAQAARDETQAARDEAQDQLDNLNNNLQQAQNARDEAQAARDEVQGQLDNLNNDLQQAQAARDELQGQLDNLNNDLQDAQNARDEARGQRDTLTGNLEEARIAHQNVSNDLQQARTARDEAQGQRDILNDNLAETRNALEAERHTRAEERQAFTSTIATMERQQNAITELQASEVVGLHDRVGAEQRRAEEALLHAATESRVEQSELFTDVVATLRRQQNTTADLQASEVAGLHNQLSAEQRRAEVALLLAETDSRAEQSELILQHEQRSATEHTRHERQLTEVRDQHEAQAIRREEEFGVVFQDTVEAHRRTTRSLLELHGDDQSRVETSESSAAGAAREQDLREQLDLAQEEAMQSQEEAARSQLRAARSEYLRRTERRFHAEVHDAANAASEALDQLSGDDGAGWGGIENSQSEVEQEDDSGNSRALVQRATSALRRQGLGPMPGDFPEDSQDA